MLHSETFSRFLEFVVKKICSNPYDLERLLFSFKYKGVIGVDEAGVGAIFGPVVAAAVLVTPQHNVISGVGDSKTLRPQIRATLDKLIRSQLQVGIGVTTPDEVNYMANIEKAGDVARQRALADLLSKTSGKYVVLSDHFCVDSDLDSVGITRGDKHVYSISVASIVAKEEHDRLIGEVVKRHPEWEVYKLQSNKGYRTKDHLNAIAKYGYTEHHRHFMREVCQATRFVGKDE